MIEIRRYESQREKNQHRFETEKEDIFFTVKQEREYYPPISMIMALLSRVTKL